MKTLINQAGSTLMEVIIAISLSIIIFFSIAYVYELSQNAYYRTDTKSELTQNGRIILDRLTRELRQTSAIITTLPGNNTDPASIPSEIIFQDGHDTSQIQYIRYALEVDADGEKIIKRQVIAYWFDIDPNTNVYFNATDQNGNLPTYHITDDRIIGEYVDDIEFWGNQLVNINIYLSKNNSQEIIYTAVYGRNS